MQKLTGFPLNFKNNIFLLYLCLALFPNTSEVQVLVLCDVYSAPPPLH